MVVFLKLFQLGCLLTIKTWDISSWCPLMACLKGKCEYLRSGSQRELVRRMRWGKVSLHESHWNLNSWILHVRPWMQHSDRFEMTQRQTSLLWQLTSKVVLLFVTRFLSFLDCEQSLLSPNFSKRKIGRLLAVYWFFNRFNFLMWLGRLRLVSDCVFV